MSDSVTILVARGGAMLAKRIWELSPNGILSYDNAELYDAFQKPVSDLVWFGRNLLTLADNPTACIIRGELIGDEWKGIRRRSYSRDGISATFRAAAHRWIALDSDSLPFPPGLTATDLEGCGRVVREALPEPFRHARALVQATASHGIKATIRLRAWFWCSRPVSDTEAKRWLADSPLDLSLFNPIQPCFTATPIFLNRLRDPLPRRFAVIPGLAEVEVPAPETLSPPPPRPVPQFSCAEAATPYVHRELALAIGLVRGADIGDRHNTIVRAAARTAALVKAGWLEEGAWRTGLMTAADEVAPDGDTRKVTDALDWALANVPAMGEEFDYVSR